MTIKTFKYKNAEGRESIKVVAVVAETATHISGISVGSLVYKGGDLVALKRAGKSFKTLDHLPRKGEGLVEFNQYYKCFKKSNMVEISSANLRNLSKQALKGLVDLKSVL